LNFITPHVPQVLISAIYIRLKDSIITAANSAGSPAQGVGGTTEKKLNSMFLTISLAKHSYLLIKATCKISVPFVLHTAIVPVTSIVSIAIEVEEPADHDSVSYFCSLTLDPDGVKKKQGHQHYDAVGGPGMVVFAFIFSLSYLVQNVREGGKRGRTWYWYLLLVVLRTHIGSKTGLHEAGCGVSPNQASQY